MEPQKAIKWGSYQVRHEDDFEKFPGFEEF